MDEKWGASKVGFEDHGVSTSPQVAILWRALNHLDQCAERRLSVRFRLHSLSFILTKDQCVLKSYYVCHGAFQI